MGRDKLKFKQFDLLTRFNPRARVGRDDRLLSHGVLDNVSIHAPAWGATGHQMALIDDHQIVSIHAPAWGATPACPRPSGSSSCFNPLARVGRDRPGAPSCPGTASFNPRARVGRDRGWWWNTDTIQLVSIHAPAWGATELGAEAVA